jgi:hypothetical protein
MSLSLQSEYLSSIELPVRPDDPAGWWHVICEVTQRLAMSGGLSHDRSVALDQLAEWEVAGITDYIAVHEECNDGAFIAEHSGIRFHHLGVDDWGDRRDPRWFDGVTEVALDVLADPDRKLMVTCWMGCNRGPSATFAILLALGWKPLPALRAIRDVRPIAGTIYAADAVEWWVERNGGSQGQIRRARRDVEEWFARNPLDLHYVIRHIGSRTGW